MESHSTLPLNLWLLPPKERRGCPGGLRLSSSSAFSYCLGCSQDLVVVAGAGPDSGGLVLVAGAVAVGAEVASVAVPADGVAVAVSAASVEDQAEAVAPVVAGNEEHR